MKYQMEDHRRNVWEAQAFLRINHLLEGGPFLNPDGIFGPETTTAVLFFQRQNGLPATGIIDYETWTLLAATAKELHRERSFSLPQNP